MTMNYMVENLIDRKLKNKLKQARIALHAYVVEAVINFWQLNVELR